MNKFIKILLTVCMLVTCFTVNVVADDGDYTFTSAGNDTDNVIDNGMIEYNNVTISDGAVVQITGTGILVIHGTFSNVGTINAVSGARIVFDNISNADGQIAVFDHWGNEFEEQPSGYMELEYVENKWVQFFPSPEFESANNGTDDNKIDGFVEYVDVTIKTGAVVVITEGSALVIHGTFTNNGTLNPSTGAHIIFDDVTQAIGKITIYDSEGNSFAEIPSGFMEFEYDGDKWKEFIPPTEVTYAISYDVNAGEVWHYEGDTFIKIDPSSTPYEFRVPSEDKIYILENSGWVYDHIEAEGDEPESPDSSIINKEELPDETIGSTTYKVVRITPNPKDNDFYYFEIKFVEDPNFSFVNKLNTLELALDSTLGAANSYAKLKEYIANQIYDRYLNSGSHYYIDDTVFKGDDFGTFKSKITILEDETEPTKTPANIDGSPADYFKFKLDGLDNFVGVVYKLSDTDQFVLRDGDTYTVIDVGNEYKLAAEEQEAAALKDFDVVQGGKIVVRKINNTVNKEESEEGPNYEIFGNYAGFPMNYTGRMQDSQDTNYISLENVMPCAGNGIDTSDFSGVSCEMILYTNDFLGVSIKGNSKAKPWSKENLPIYPTNSGEEEATVFFGNESIEITTPYEAPSGSTITDIKFEGGATSWNDCNITSNSGTFTVTFGSIFYDKVPLEITYSNGTTNSFVVARTGLSIGDYPAPGGSNSVEICGETVNFTDDNKWVIAAQYYYDSSSPSDRVSLFAKITDSDGNIQTKLISNTINNSAVHTDDTDYTCNKYDVFELWRGKGDDRPQKIEVIAFVQGDDDDSFGGVKLGNGNGVKWTLERGRQ